MTYLEPADVAFTIIPVTISIVFTLLTSSKPLKPSQKITRWFRSLIPLMLNILILIILSILEFSANSDYKIAEIPNLLKWPGLITIICSIIALPIIFFTTKKDKDLYSQDEIDKYYIKLTKDMGDDKKITIIGGNLDFLGEICNINANNSCKNNILENNFKKCSNCKKKKYKKNRCIIKNEQYVQLYDAIINRRCSLDMLSKKPNFTLEYAGHLKYRLILGKLLHDFGQEVEIRFYRDKHPNLIRGRIITTHDDLQKLYWHWKKGNNEFRPATGYNDNDPEGKTILFLFTNLWENSEKLDDSQRENLKKEYKDYVSNKET